MYQIASSGVRARCTTQGELRCIVTATPDREPAPSVPPAPDQPSLVEKVGVGASVLGVMALAAPPLGSIALFWAMGNTELGPWLKSHGLAGVAMYTICFAVLAGLALLPTYAQSALGGWAFGVTWGIPAALVGFVGGAWIGYEIARRTSGDKVEAVIEAKPKWKAVRDALLGSRLAGQKLTWKDALRTTGMIALLRLPPNSPFAFTNLLMASVKVPRLPFLVGTFIGMTPRTAIAVIIGAGVKDMLNEDNLKQAAPGWLWGVGIGVTLLIVVIVGMIANKAIERMTAAKA